MSGNRQQVPTRKTYLFWLLISVEALAAAVATLAFGESLGAGWLLGRSLTRWLIAGGLLVLALVAVYLAFAARKQPGWWGSLTRRMTQPWLVYLPPLFLLVLSAGLFVLDPGVQALARLLPLLLFLLVAVVQSAYALQRCQPIAVVQLFQPIASRPLALAGILMLYAAILLPSGVRAHFNGLPWNNQGEFMLVLFALPLATLVNWRVFQTKIVLALGALAFLLKLVLAIGAPQNGLMLTVYSSEQAAGANLAEPLYEGYFRAGDAMILEEPLYELRAFPIEWINQASYKLADLWLEMRLEGQLELDGNTSLALLTAGARDGRASLVSATGNRIAVPLVTDAAQAAGTAREPLPAGLYHLAASVTYAGDANYQLLPLKIDAVGNVTEQAFGAFWLPDEKSGAIASASLFRLAAKLSDIILYTSLCLVPLLAYALSIRRGTLTAFDGCLAALGLVAFVLLKDLAADQLRLWLPWLLLAAFSLAALSTSMKTNLDKPGLRRYLALIAPMLLLVFLRFDFGRLRLLEFFPLLQDNLSYQIFARQIFLRGDPLALGLNPHAYKILFPYIVGGFHVLFGQSSAALFFLNAWCALFTSGILFSILLKNGVKSWLAFLGSFLFIWLLASELLFIFYFRFGLIEPLGILSLFLTIYAAYSRRLFTTLFFAILTMLLRLDYAGGVLTAVILFGHKLTGGLEVWQDLFSWLRRGWKSHLARVVIVLLPSAALILLYRLLKPDYILNASDTHYTSLTQRLGGVVNVLLGGRFNEIADHFAAAPWATFVLLAVLVLGTVAMVGLLFVRRGLFARVDLGWALLFIGSLTAYLIVSPTGYSPRFSLPFIFLAILVLTLIISLRLDDSRTVKQ